MSNCMMVLMDGVCDAVESYSILQGATSVIYINGLDKMPESVVMVAQRLEEQAFS